MASVVFDSSFLLNLTKIVWSIIDSNLRIGKRVQALKCSEYNEVLNKEGGLRVLQVNLDGYKQHSVYKSVQIRRVGVYGDGIDGVGGRHW